MVKPLSVAAVTEQLRFGKKFNGTPLLAFEAKLAIAPNYSKLGSGGLEIATSQM